MLPLYNYTELRKRYVALWRAMKRIPMPHNEIFWPQARVDELNGKIRELEEELETTEKELISLQNKYADLWVKLGDLVDEFER
jgi:uncharacterized coiled-coil DUF342 family protein